MASHSKIFITRLAAPLASSSSTIPRVAIRLARPAALGGLSQQRLISTAGRAPRSGLISGSPRTLLGSSSSMSKMQGGSLRLPVETSVHAHPIALARTMFIQTESTPNDASLKFIPGVTVMQNNGTYEILDARSSLVSPLAVKLMGIEGVTSVFFGPDFVTVSKDDTQPWNLLKPEIFAILMEHFTSGKALFNADNQDLEDGPQDTKILDTDSEVVAMIKELLDTRVRPAIQEDGGDIEYKGFSEDTGIVSLRLKGSCRGCSSSSVTLKSGIERMLQHYIPEVQSVEQVLDEEEMIALDEFAKLEKRLEGKKGQEEKEG